MGDRRWRVATGAVFPPPLPPGYNFGMSERRRLIENMSRIFCLSAAILGVEELVRMDLSRPPFTLAGGTIILLACIPVAAFWTFHKWREKTKRT
jgi:hypothetical protein